MEIKVIKTIIQTGPSQHTYNMKIMLILFHGTKRSHGLWGGRAFLNTARTLLGPIIVTSGCPPS